MYIMNPIKRSYNVAKTGLIAGVISAYSLLPNYSDAQVLSKELPQVESTIKTSSLEELTDKSIPEELKKLGFTSGPYVKRNSSKELIIIAENHEAKELKGKERKLIEFLIKTYSADSLGLEGCSGEYPEVQAPADIFPFFTRKAAREYLPQDKLMPIYGISTLQVMENLVYMNKAREFLFDRYPGYANFKTAEKLLQQESFGNKELDAAVLREFRSQRGFFSSQKKKEEVIRRFEETNLPKEFKETFLKCLKEEVIDESTFSRLLYLDSVYTHETRSIDFAKNINHFMEKNNSKRGIIIVGAAHLHSDSIGLRNMQDFLPYSYRVIYGPEVDEIKAKELIAPNLPEKITKRIENLDKTLEEKLKKEFEKAKKEIKQLRESEEKQVKN